MAQQVGDVKDCWRARASYVHVTLRRLQNPTCCVRLLQAQLQERLAEAEERAGRAAWEHHETLQVRLYYHSGWCSEQLVLLILC